MTIKKKKDLVNWRHERGFNCVAYMQVCNSGRKLTTRADRK